MSVAVLPPTDARTQTAAFLHALFDDKPSELYILIWTIRGKKKESKWFRSVEQAAMYAGNRAHINTYVGVSLSDRDRGPHERGEIEDSAGIVGLWADIDIKHPVHKKQNLPPDLNSALSLLDGLPQPTLIVHTGHGIQPWWLFKEPWTFDGDTAERRDARTLAKWWVQTLRITAEAKGWDVDSTYPLTQVLRVPGTTNCKGELVDVTCSEIDDLRYNPGDFEKYLKGREPSLDETDQTRGGGGPAVDGALILSPDAQPPLRKLDALRENDAKFKKSWERRRTDFQDQSASTYCMSLASIAVGAGWTDQEIADLLICWRQERGEDLKDLRQDWYQRTINKARESRNGQKAQEQAAETLADDGSKEPEDVLRAVSTQLGVRITRLVKITGDPATYIIYSDDKKIELGGAGSLLDQGSFRKKMLDLANIVVPRRKTDVWDRIVQALVGTAETLDAGDEASQVTQLQYWVDDYLEVKMASSATREHGRELARARQPFRLDGRVHLSAPELVRWLFLHRAERVESRRLAVLLRAAGWTYKRETWRDGKDTFCRGLWRKPLGDDDRDE